MGAAMNPAARCGGCGALTPEDVAAMKQCAIQQLTTGAQAKVWASCSRDLNGSGSLCRKRQERSLKSINHFESCTLKHFGAWREPRPFLAALNSPQIPPNAAAIAIAS